MNFGAIVVAIDSFDHHQYAPSVRLGSGPPVPRPGGAARLSVNYDDDGTNKNQDRRPFVPHSSRRYVAFSSGETEKVQYLLLADEPLHDITSVVHPSAGYNDRHEKAMDRWASFNGSGESVAMQIIRAYRITNASMIQSRDIPNPSYSRLRLNLNDGGTLHNVVYTGTQKPRYLFLQPGLNGSVIPDFIHANCANIPAVKRWFDYAPGRRFRPNLPKCAVGCTCRDFVFNGLKDPTLLNPGPSFYGCKHIIYYNWLQQYHPDRIR